MTASVHNRPLAWHVVPAGTDLTAASSTFNTGTEGTTISAGVATTYGLPTDAVGHLVGVNAAANNVTVTITNASAATRARSRVAFERTDRVASRVVTITGVTMARPHHNANGADLTTITLGVDEVLVLEKRNNSAIMEIVAGSSCVAASAT